jgi:hypothetical protein
MRFADGTSAHCVEGEIRIRYFQGIQEYRGSYDFTFSDGTSKKGLFRAEHCPAEG